VVGVFRLHGEVVGLEPEVVTRVHDHESRKSSGHDQEYDHGVGSRLYSLDSQR